MSDSEMTQNYIQKIFEYRLLTIAEEAELAAKIKQGDSVAKEKLIVSNLRLVVKIAHDYRSLGLPISDLISEGNIGMMKAAEKFDPEKGTKFSSYASWWIKQRMRRALANQIRDIRIPIQSAKKLRNIQRIQSELRNKLKREPAEDEMVKATGFSVRTIKNLLNCASSSVSIHTQIGGVRDTELGDLISSKALTPEEIVIKSETIDRMNNYISHLSDREKLVLELRFGLLSNRPSTLEEVSQAISRTRERVRQIQNKAILKLKRLMI